AIAALDGEDWVALPPLATVLRAPEGRERAQVEVQLQASMTEVGTLEVRCVALQDGAAQDQEAPSWLLPFAVRDAAAPNAADSGAARAMPASAGGQNNIESTETPRARALALVDRLFGTQMHDVGPKEVRQLRQSL